MGTARGFLAGVSLTISAVFVWSQFAQQQQQQQQQQQTERKADAHPSPPSPSPPALPAAVSGLGLDPLPFSQVLPSIDAVGVSGCRHTSPSIVSSHDPAKPLADVCSWWADMGWKGRLPLHRLGTQLDTVPPRSLCHSDRVCLDAGRLCLGHALQKGSEANFTFCPHHDGPAALRLQPCGGHMRQHAGTRQHCGAGQRSYVMVHHRWAVDGDNVWHWVTTMMDIFGAIIEAEPHLVDESGNYSPTKGVVSLMIMPLGWQRKVDLFQAGSSAYMSGWDRKKEKELRIVLSGLSSCPLDLPDPQTPRCFDNAVLGTPTQLFLQWEDRVVAPHQVAMAKAFASFLVRTASKGHQMVAAGWGEQRSPVAGTVWEGVYGKRSKPRLLLMMRGEGVKADGKRQMKGVQHVEAAAQELGFEVQKAYGNTTLFQQILLAAGADVILGVHGAALAWATVMPPHGVLVELRTTQDLVDRTFIYPGLSSLRDIGYIPWYQTEPVVDAPDPRLPFDTFFTVTPSSARFHLAVTMKLVAKRCPWFRKPGRWRKP